MRKYFFILFFACASCVEHEKTDVNNALSEKVYSDSVVLETVIDGTDEDSIVISTYYLDTIKYSKKSLDTIKSNHPEFTEDYFRNPDDIYFCKGEGGGFSSEVGRDEYYLLYAHFLREKNGKKKYEERRKKLIDIYLNINSLFARFQYGGTYFGHQIPRILGYAEYSISIYKYEEEFPREKSYDITLQKTLYIQSLRQLVRDENSIDFNTLGSKKIERLKELNTAVDEIDAAITDIFYLRRAQEFHYSKYEYY